MFCPKCGKEMSEDHVYCPSCGSELQLVPEYKGYEEILKEVPDKEKISKDSIEELLEDIEYLESRKNITKPSGSHNQNKKTTQKKTNKKTNKNKVLLAQIIGLTLLIIVAVSGIIIFFGSQSKKNSDTYQIEKAEDALKKNDYQEALEYYKKAYEINSRNLEVVKGIAFCYYELGDKESAALYYLEAAEENPKDEEPFKILLEIYNEENNQEGIRNLYGIAQIQSIRDLFAGYLTTEPLFSVEEGTYNQLMEISITMADKGDIYYTLDGSTATEESKKYQEPIPLKEGKTVVHAIAVTKTGQVSSEIVKTYEIVLETPKAPGISPDSGKYSEPTRVEVAVEEGSTVYYTTDGSVPTEESRTCKQSFPMPIGNNIISVLYIDKNGKTSEVTKKNYNLTVSMEVSEDQALVAIKNAMIQKGEMENVAGYVTGADGLFIFRVFCVEEILGEQYYIIERYKEFYSGGERFLNYYAYNIATGKIYNATMDGSDAFKLSAF